MQFLIRSGKRNPMVLPRKKKLIVRVILSARFSGAVRRGRHLGTLIIRRLALSLKLVMGNRHRWVTFLFLLSLSLSEVARLGLLKLTTKKVVVRLKLPLFLLRRTRSRHVKSMVRGVSIILLKFFTASVLFRPLFLELRLLVVRRPLNRKMTSIKFIWVGPRNLLVPRQLRRVRVSRVTKLPRVVSRRGPLKKFMKLIKILCRRRRKTVNIRK